ncbi:MAG: hypothetical protein QXF14_01130 [Candidatus Woesearchaeota archaeon]
MADSLDDLMRGVSFSFFKPINACVNDVKQAWELFYASRTAKQDEEFANSMRAIDCLDPMNAGIARYVLLLGIVQGRQYSAGVPVERILELSSSLAGIQKSRKQFPFTALEKCALETGKRLVAGEKIDYIETIINEISYLLS